jgi:putative transposase
MQLVEQHVMKHTDSRYQAIDEAAFASKNLYNAANYLIRQSFIHEGVYLCYEEMHTRMKSHEAYKALPRKVSQQVLRLLHKNWVSFFKAIEAFKRDPSQFLGRPCLPKYKDKQHGRNILVYTIQAISKHGLKRGLLQPSGLPLEVQTKHTSINQVRSIPRAGYYVVEVIYEQAETQADVDPDLYAGIDIGIANLATLTSNKVGFLPRIVNGRPLKSMNQYYNKRKADLQSIL